MVVIGTKYDKDLKEKVFYIREVESYTHSTTTSLNVAWSEGVFTLTAIVDNIVGKGYVKFYKDGTEIGEQYVSKTATLLYPSETQEGVFMARFMGNSDCLKSESPEVNTNKTTTLLTVSHDGASKKYVGDTVTVTVTLKDNDGGVITGESISDGSTSKTTDSKGVVTFTYANSSTGSVSKSYTYDGDEEYTSSTGVANWSVILIPTSITLSASKTSCYVGDTISMTATVYDDRTGKVIPSASVDMNGTSKTTDSSGKVTVSVSATSEGSYQFYAQAFKSSTMYDSSTKATTSYTVSKYNTTLTVATDSSSCYVGDTTTVTVTLKDSNNNVVSGVSISDGSTSKTTSSSGVATFTYSNSSEGTVTKEYNFTGTSKYNSSTKTARWIVSKLSTTMTITSDKSTYVVGGTAVLTATLVDVRGNPVQGVTVNFDGSSLTTDSKGSVSKTYSNLSKDISSKYCIFSGNSKYDTSNSFISITVVDKDVPVLSASPSVSSCYVGDSVTVTVQLLDGNGSPLSDASVSDGSVTSVTGVDGKVTFTYNNGASGSVTKSYSFSGDSEHTGASCNASWTVNKYNTSMTVSGYNSSYYVDDTATVTVTLKDSKGAVISGASVSDGSTSKTTNSSGVATFTYANSASGSVSKTYSYAGATKYNSASGSAKWTVIKYTSTLTLTTNKSSYYIDDKVTLTGVLKDNTGNPIANASLTVYNGATVTTNSDGKFTTTYQCTSTGSQSKTYTYAGNTKYEGCNSSVSWTVNAYNTVLTVTSDKTSYYVGDTATVTATLKTSTGTVISGASVVIDGSTVTTNSNGVATKSFSCSSVGSVSKSVSYAGATKYNSCTGSVSYTVSLKPTVTTLSASASSVLVGESVTLTATVKDSNGNAVTTGEVCLDVDGGDYGGDTVDSNGVVTFTLSSDSAISHLVRAWYVSNSSYASSESESLTITWSDSTVTPELTLSGESLIGESGDTLSLSLASNLTGGSVSLVDSDDGSVYATGTVASDGSCTLLYPCTGLGDKNVCVQYINGSEVTESNILQIEDCLLTGFDGTETFTDIGSGVSNYSYSSDNELIYVAATNSELLMDKTFTASDGEWVVEYDLKFTGTRGVLIRVRPVNQVGEECMSVNQATYYYEYWVNPINANECKTTSKTNGTYHHIKLVMHDGVGSIYCDDVLMFSNEVDWGTTENVIHLGAWAKNTGTEYIKNLRIKPYSE